MIHGRSAIPRSPNLSIAVRLELIAEELMPLDAILTRAMSIIRTIILTYSDIARRKQLDYSPLSVVVP